LRLLVEKPGMFTTVQDLGRRGFQALGVPVAGAMDSAALRLGNVLVGNEPASGNPALEPAGLEITVLGPVLRAEGSGCFAVTGADAMITVNGLSVPSWTAIRVWDGDEIAVTALRGGARAYFCVSGGVDVPVVMGSRSTYTRGKFGGLDGRALAAGDVLTTGTPDLLWEECEWLTLPEALRPVRDPNAPLRTIPGPQDAGFTKKGTDAFYTSEYTITNAADRMGYRMEGAEIEHKAGADIISDAVALGSVQVPGHGMPIVMLADRQTTGGYTKIATVCAVDVEALSQRLPGQRVRFEMTTPKEAVALLRYEEELIAEARRLRATWRSRPHY
jgi:biotin-dependent carboxylase-like uncharacterized protein